MIDPLKRELEEVHNRFDKQINDKPTLNFKIASFHDFCEMEIQD